MRLSILGVVLTAVVGKRLAEVVNGLASKHQQGLVFVGQSPALTRFKSASADVITVHQVDEGDPQVVFVDGVGQMHNHTGNLSEKAIMRFINDRLFGKPEKHAEASPKTAPRGKVLKLDHTNFHQTVMRDSEKAYFIKFYAPWCGHCRAIEDTWKQLAAQVDQDIMVIAEVNADAEKQLAAEFGVQGFPTILLFPAGRKNKDKVIPYNGERSLKGFLSFAQTYGAKSARIKQIVSNDVYQKECTGEDLCMILWVPHIYDSNAKERKRYVATLKKVRQAQQSDIPIKYLWTEASNSLELEKFFRLEFGWPAVIVVNHSKGVFATHRGGISEPALTDFVDGVLTGKYKPEKVNIDAMPPWPKVDPWNGKDAPSPPPSAEEL